jgi:hypothetical protein
VYEVIGESPSARRFVRVALKLVQASSAPGKADEWWVKTAIPFGAKVLKKAGKMGLLRPLTGSAAA